MKHIYSSITLNFFVVLALTANGGRTRSNMVPEIKNAIQQNNHEKVAFLLETYKSLPKININKEEEVLIPLSERKKSSMIDLSGLKSNQEGTPKIVAPIDPNLIEFLQTAKKVMEENQNNTQVYGLTDFFRWSGIAQTRFSIASIVLLGSLAKTGFDVAAIFDGTNTGFKVVADLLGDGTLLLISLWQLYEGYKNKDGRQKYHQACAIKQNVETIALEQVHKSEEIKKIK